MPTPYAPQLDIRRLYDRFTSPIAALNCGAMCKPHNPSGKPYCCDICQAVPAAFHIEWEYFKTNTDLWHLWRGDECPGDSSNPGDLDEETPNHMCLLACQGPQHCQREFRALSCRQFPFFPYVTADYRFLGLACEWEFEPVCWVISHLDQVSESYRLEFVRTYDELFALWQEEFESYAAKSEQMRARFTALKRRIPLLHRRGGWYLLSPGSERLARVDPRTLRRFGPYAQEAQKLD